MTTRAHARATIAWRARDRFDRPRRRWPTPRASAASVRRRRMDRAGHARSEPRARSTRWRRSPDDRRATRRRPLRCDRHRDPRWPACRARDARTRQRSPRARREAAGDIAGRRARDPRRGRRPRRAGRLSPAPSRRARADSRPAHRAASALCARFTSAGRGPIPRSTAGAREAPTRDGGAWRHSARTASISRCGSRATRSPTSPRGARRRRDRRAAEVVLRFAAGALAHVSIATTHRAQPVLAIAGDTGEIDAIGTLGARGEGIVVHRARGATAALPFVPEDPYLRQLRVFAARCAASARATTTTRSPTSAYWRASHRHDRSSRSGRVALGPHRVPRQALPAAIFDPGEPVVLTAPPERAYRSRPTASSSRASTTCSTSHSCSDRDARPRSACSLPTSSRA